MSHIITNEMLQDVKKQGFQLEQIIFGGQCKDGDKHLYVRIQPLNNNYVVYDVKVKNNFNSVLCDRQFDKIEEAIEYYNKI